MFVSSEYIALHNKHHDNEQCIYEINKCFIMHYINENTDITIFKVKTHYYNHNKNAIYSIIIWTLYNVI